MSVQPAAEGWPTCACGCGEPVQAVRRTDNLHGKRIGDPMKYAGRSHMPKQRRMPVKPGETRTCLKCEAVKPLEQFVTVRPRASNPVGRGNVCMACRNAAKSKKRKRVTPAKDRAFGDVIHSLPPYDKLKYDYLTLGLSQREIAAKYGVTQRAVTMNLRRRAEVRGEWPLLSDRQRALRRAWQRNNKGKSDYFIPDGGLIRDLLVEYIAEQGITKGEMARRAGLREGYILEQIYWHNKGVRHGIRTEHAVKILQAIGEPVPERLQKAAEQHASGSTTYVPKYIKKS